MKGSGQGQTEGSAKPISTIPEPQVVIIEPAPTTGDEPQNTSGLPINNGSYNGSLPVTPVPSIVGEPDGTSVFGDKAKPYPRTPTPIGEYQTPEGQVYQFRPFDKEAYQRLLVRQAKLKAAELERKNRVNEGRLVDGELKWDEEEEEVPTRDLALVEGNNLSDDLDAAFPPELVGKPIDEIDPYLIDKVSVLLFQ